MKKIVICLCLVAGLFLGLPSFAVDYSRFDKNDINSIRNATMAYQKEYDKKRGTKEAEEDYIKFHEFYMDTVMIQSRKVSFPFMAYRNSYYLQAKKYSKAYYSKGFAVTFDEGEFSLTNSNRYLYRKFAPYLPKPWKELLKFSVQFDKPTISDWRYIIPKSRLEKNIHFYENFVKKYPNFVRVEELKSCIEILKQQLDIYPELI